jgi:predicted peroxiredoxin
MLTLSVLSGCGGPKAVKENVETVKSAKEEKELQKKAQEAIQKGVEVPRERKNY